ncbi:hypothetical protein AB0I66_24495 [Streptomyces sp. NPDC050439]|uniref:hypothetical protein n=1 Tax=unclassified Streptomyces TaxID=2593676 RepID=UPI003413EE91
MAELPTAAAPSTTPAVTQALANIEASKLTAGASVAECLDAVGDLIRITRKPSVVFDWVIRLLEGETLKYFAAQSRIILHESRATEEERLPRAIVIWMADGTGMAIVPQGQHPHTVLLQLHEEVAQRQEDMRRAAAFQASVAAGHVESVDTWHARTSNQAGR